MSREISPLERAMQILQEIELDERAPQQTKKAEKAPLQRFTTVSENTSEEGVSLEGSPARPESSPVYSEEIVGSESTLLQFDSQSILNGVIFSEIFGKPRSMKRGR